MPILSFGEYRPDETDYMQSLTDTIQNVVPRADGYGPFPAATPYSGAMAAVNRGYFYAKKNDGSISIFAGTLNKLYNMANTTGTWTDVSKGATTYSDLSGNAQWQFAQFNKFVFAVNANTVPQVFDLTTSTSFSDLAGSPPQAASIAIVNRFIVLSGIASPNVYRIQWSGLNATTTWSSGVSQSDFQDFADGGFVRGVAGGEFGYIFQDTAIRRMTYAPGSPYIFGIDRVATDDGLFAPYSLVGAADRVFYLAPSGFKMLLPGAYPQSIGKERVDRTFFKDVDTSAIQLIIGASDPKNTRVFFAYKSGAGAAGNFDKVLCYDWVIDRWAPILMSGEYIASMAVPGLTLEQVDTAYGSNIDTLALGSLDVISTSAYARPSIMSTAHMLSFLSGANLEATLFTAEQGGDGKRLFVRGFRPVTDATTIYGSVTRRESLQAAAVTTAETLADAVGTCPQRVSTRYARGKVRIPAGATWTYAAGVEPDVTTDGLR